MGDEASEGGDAGDKDQRSDQGQEAVASRGREDAEAADEAEQGGQDVSDEEDCGTKPVAPDPGTPTQAEIDEHNVDHLPYRSWCDCCVRGKATGEPHRRATPESRIPIIAFDYMFVTKDKVSMADEISDEDKKDAPVKILVVKDTKSKAVFAHVVKKKGADEEGYAVKRLAEDLAWLGYTKVILKSDGERAIVRLLKETLRVAKTDAQDMEQISYEHPPPYDSKSNGAVESACKAVKGQLRAMKLCLEQKVQKRIPEEHPIIAWLVEHAAWLLTTRVRGEEEHTAYERVRGRPCAKKLVEFGERVLCKKHMKGPKADERPTLDSRWGHGIWLGLTRHTNEYVLWSGSDVIHSRSIMRLQKSHRWDLEALQGITGSVQKSRGEETGPTAEFQEGDIGIPMPGAPDTTRAPKTIVVRQADWLKHGGTTGCPKCIHARDFGWGKTGGPHSPACVERFKKIFAETADGQERLQHAQARHQAWLSRRQELEPPREDAAEGDPHVAFEDDPDQLPPAQGEADEESKGHEDMDDAKDGEDDEMFDAGSVGEEVPMTPETTPMSNDEQMSTLEPIMNVVTEDVVSHLKRYNEEILKLVNELGGGPRAYARERNKRLKYLVTEIYSPPRVTDWAKLLPSMEVIPGLAFDLTTCDENGKAWDFADEERRRACRRRIEEQRPEVVVGSPMCTAFCLWQKLNAVRGDPIKIKKAWTEAMVHLNFACEIYAMQIQAGRYFLHEHPAYATSWQQSCVNKLLKHEDVSTVIGDQCQYGQRAKGTDDPIKKPTRWMSNAPKILEMLGRRCKGRGGACSMGGFHRLCSGGRAREAAIYPFALCKAILQGIRNQMRHDHRLQEGMCGLQALELETQDVVANLLEIDDEVEVCTMSKAGKVLDSLTGQPLDPELVRKARQEELKYFKDKGVWTKKPRQEAYQRMGKAPISVKWIDVNKGDNITPKYRSRLVAREIRRAGEDPIFAPTPPLESLRTVLSLAMTDLEGDDKHIRDGISEERTQIMVIDISRAYFNASKGEDGDPKYVELPDEDPDKEKGLCGMLNVHMYGTRAAADGWHGEYSATLKGLGFSRGDASACVFRNPARRLTASVHGDDFTIAGPKSQLDWLKLQMEQKYELTELGRLGPGETDDKEVKVLNRMIRWTSRGVEYEADPRQVERFVVDLGLEGCKHVSTPGVKQTHENLQKDQQLPEYKQTAYRAVAARGNYIAADRPELQFPAKEICRWMASPSDSGTQALKRMGRFLEHHKRLVYQYPFQEARRLDVYSDTDWAGCIRTRKSTSGGCIMVGKHLIKSWSSTQALISLSSGEAEFYGVVKASGMALGFQALLKDLDVRMPIRVWTDSSATMGICTRQGLGKLRHVDTRCLWVQQRVRNGDVELRKVRGDMNPADLFTKHLASETKIEDLLRLFGCKYEGGRARGAPELRRDLEAKHEGVLAAEVDQAGDFVVQDGYAYYATITEDGERVPEAWVHDERLLPHQVCGNLAALFPRAIAGPELPEVWEREDPIECRGGALARST